MIDPYKTEKVGLRKAQPVVPRNPSEKIDPDRPKIRKEVWSEIARFNKAVAEQEAEAPEEQSEGEALPEPKYTDEENRIRDMLGSTTFDSPMVVKKDDDGEIIDTKLGLDDLPEDYQRVFYRGTPTDNPKVRSLIDERSSPLEVSDLIMTGRVRQLRPIIPGKLEVVFQSLTAADGMWVETQAHLRFPGDLIAQRIWAGNARTVLGCIDINDKSFPDVYLDRKVDIASFEEKFSVIYDSMSENVLDILVTNWNWFSDAVASLLENDFGQLKNG